MEIRDIRAALQAERKQSELQDLDEDFYQDVNELLIKLHNKRDELVEQSDDPFTNEEVKRVSDKIETVQDNIESLYQRRSGKIVKKASFTAADINDEISGVTNEEEEIFQSLVTELERGQEKVFNTINPKSNEDEKDTDEITNTQPNNSVETTANESPPQPEEALLNTDTESGEKSESNNDTSENESVKKDSWKAENKPDEESDELNSNTDKKGESIEDFGDDETVDIERITVRIKDDIGEILGVDNREYSLNKQDVVTLPETNAETLISNDAAKKLHK